MDSDTASQPPIENTLTFKDVDSGDMNNTLTIQVYNNSQARVSDLVEGNPFQTRWS